MPYYSVYSSDFIVDTLCMSDSDVAAFSILMAFEGKMGPLPNDREKLSQLIRREVSDEVISKFSINDDGDLFIPLIEEGRENWVKTKIRTSMAGKASAERRARSKIESESNRCSTSVGTSVGTSVPTSVEQLESELELEQSRVQQSQPHPSGGHGEPVNRVNLSLEAPINGKPNGRHKTKPEPTVFERVASISYPDTESVTDDDLIRKDWHLMFGVSMPISLRTKECWDAAVEWVKYVNDKFVENGSEKGKRISGRATMAAEVHFWSKEGYSAADFPMFVQFSKVNSKICVYPRPFFDPSSRSRFSPPAPHEVPDSSKLKSIDDKIAFNRGLVEKASKALEAGGLDTFQIADQKDLMKNASLSIESLQKEREKYLFNPVPA